MFRSPGESFFHPGEKRKEGEVRNGIEVEEEKGPNSASVCQCERVSDVLFYGSLIFLCVVPGLRLARGLIEKGCRCGSR